MLKKVAALIVFLVFCKSSFSQIAAQDTVYLMNGHAIGQRVIDTTLGAVTIFNPEKTAQKLNFEFDQLYMVRYANGNKRYYYTQDSTLNNWFTRDEMWLYMKGENDARRGFKARGALIGGSIAGLLGGLTGTFWAPIAPYGFMALSGITKVRIRHETVSHPNFIESDAYILGYERVARQKRKTRSLIGGTAGLIIGYGLYAILHQYYPESVNFGFGR